MDIDIDRQQQRILESDRSQAERIVTTGKHEKWTRKEDCDGADALTSA